MNEYLGSFKKIFIFYKNILIGEMDDFTDNELNVKKSRTF